MIREKLAEKVKPAKEAGLVLIAIPTTKRKAGLKVLLQKVLRKAKHGCQELEAIHGYQKFLGLSQRFNNRFNIVIFQLNNIEKTVKVTQQRKFSSILFSVDALLTSRFFNSCFKIIPSKFFFNSLKVLKPHQRLIVLCNAMRFDLTFYSALTRCTTNENVQFMILPHLGELAELFSTS